jgi:hypothetical protein
MLQLESDGWDELSRLIDTALELSAEARAEWLESLGEGEMKDRLRSILARSAHVETSDFLGALPPLHASDTELASLKAPTEVAGEQVGPYRLVRELGRGGMSAVWPIRARTRHSRGADSPQHRAPLRRRDQRGGAAVPGHRACRRTAHRCVLRRQ